jgi:hypothetical protein
VISVAISPPGRLVRVDLDERRAALAFFAPYQQAGLRRFNLPPRAGSAAASIELAGEVK